MPPANPPPSRAVPVTLKDVARATGVHFSTVSLALSGSAKVAAATRDQVRLAAARLGYRRDPVYFALSARRSPGRTGPKPPLIAFLTNRTSRRDFDKVPHMPGFLAGARAQAHAMGFRCEESLVGEPAWRGVDLDAELARRDVQGVILAAFLPHLPQIQLDWSRYALVKIDSSFMAPAVTRISYDQHQIVGEACRRLHARGYRRIGMAVGRFDEESSDQLYSTGYLLQQHLLGVAPVPPLFFGYAEPPAESARRLGVWVREHQLDAVISNWGTIPSLLRRAGLRPPHDLACACLCLNAPDPALAGMVMDHRTVGAKAVETIALLLKTRQFGPPPAPPALYVEARWSEGRSAPLRSPAN